MSPLLGLTNGDVVACDFKIARKGILANSDRMTDP